MSEKLLLLSFSAFIVSVRLIQFGCDDIQVSSYVLKTYGLKTTIKTFSSTFNTPFEKSTIHVFNATIPILCCRVFNFSHELEVLEFDNCNIKHIESCFSEKVQHVTGTIKITNNRITVIEKDTFRNLNLLQIILLKNSIAIIEDGAFANLPNLVSITLSQNHLSTINSNGFAYLPVLNIIDLSLNRITHLDRGDFGFCQATLVTIFLECNEIFNIDGAFDGMLSTSLSLYFVA